MTRTDIISIVAKGYAPKAGKTRDAFIDGMTWADNHQWYNMGIRPGDNQLLLAAFDIAENDDTKERKVSVGLATFLDGKFYQDKYEVHPVAWMMIPSIEEPIGSKEQCDTPQEEVVLAELTEEEIQKTLPK